MSSPTYSIAKNVLTTNNWDGITIIEKLLPNKSYIPYILHMNLDAYAADGTGNISTKALRTVMRDFERAKNGGFKNKLLDVMLGSTVVQTLYSDVPFADIPNMLDLNTVMYESTTALSRVRAKEIINAINKRTNSSVSIKSLQSRKLKRNLGYFNRLTVLHPNKLLALEFATEIIFDTVKSTFMPSGISGHLIGFYFKKISKNKNKVVITNSGLGVMYHPYEHPIIEYIVSDDTLKSLIAINFFVKRHVHFDNTYFRRTLFKNYIRIYYGLMYAAMRNDTKYSDILNKIGTIVKRGNDRNKLEDVLKTLQYKSPVPPTKTYNVPHQMAGSCTFYGIYYFIYWVCLDQKLDPMEFHKLFCYVRIKNIYRLQIIINRRALEYDSMAYAMNAHIQHYPEYMKRNFGPDVGNYYKNKYLNVKHLISSDKEPYSLKFRVSNNLENTLREKKSPPEVSVIENYLQKFNTIHTQLRTMHSEFDLDIKDFPSVYKDSTSAQYIKLIKWIADNPSKTRNDEFIEKFMTNMKWCYDLGLHNISMEMCLVLLKNLWDPNMVGVVKESSGNKDVYKCLNQPFYVLTPKDIDFFKNTMFTVVSRLFKSNAYKRTTIEKTSAYVKLRKTYPKFAKVVLYIVSAGPLTPDAYKEYTCIPRILQDSPYTIFNAPFENMGIGDMYDALVYHPKYLENGVVYINKTDVTYTKRCNIDFDKYLDYIKTIKPNPIQALYIGALEHINNRAIPSNIIQILKKSVKKVQPGVSDANDTIQMILCSILQNKDDLPRHFPKYVYILNKKYHVTKKYTKKMVNQLHSFGNIKSDKSYAIKPMERLYVYFMNRILSTLPLGHTQSLFNNVKEIVSIEDAALVKEDILKLFPDAKDIRVYIKDDDWTIDVDKDKTVYYDQGTNITGLVYKQEYTTYISSIEPDIKYPTIAIDVDGTQTIRNGEWTVLGLQEVEIIPSSECIVCQHHQNKQKYLCIFHRLGGLELIHDGTWYYEDTEVIVKKSPIFGYFLPNALYLKDNRLCIYDSRMNSFGKKEWLTLHGKELFHATLPKHHKKHYTVKLHPLHLSIEFSDITSCISTFVYANRYSNVPLVHYMWNRIQFMKIPYFHFWNYDESLETITLNSPFRALVFPESNDYLERSYLFPDKYNYLKNSKRLSGNRAYTPVDITKSIHNVLENKITINGGICKVNKSIGSIDDHLKHTQEKYNDTVAYIYENILTPRNTETYSMMELVVKSENIPHFYNAIVAYNQTRVYGALKKFKDLKKGDKCQELMEFNRYLTKGTYYNGTREWWMCFFEVIFFNIIRQDQYDIFNDIIKDINNTTTTKNVFEMLMGKGKTTVITPLLAMHYLYSPQQTPRNIVLAMPKQLVSQSKLIMVKYTDPFIYYGIDMVECQALKNSTPCESSTGKLLTITTGTDLQASLIASSKSNNFKQLNDWVIVMDEFDSMLDPVKSQLNYPRQETATKPFMIDTILFMTFQMMNAWKAFDSTLNRPFVDFSKVIVPEVCKSAYRDAMNAKFNNLSRALYVFSKWMSTWKECMKLKYNKDFGFSEYEEDTNTAIPYSAVNTPMEGSEYTDIYMRIILTYMSYYKRGVSMDQLTNVLLFIYGKNIPNTSNAIIELFEIPKDLHFKLREDSLEALREKRDIEMNYYSNIYIKPRVYNKQKRNSNIINMYVTNFIEPDLDIYKEQYNTSFVDVIHSHFCPYRTGFSGTSYITLPNFGTPNNEFTGISPDKEAETEIKRAITYNKNVFNANSEKDLLGMLIDYNCLIDVAAYFYKNTTREVVEKIYDAFGGKKIIVFVDSDDAIYERSGSGYSMFTGSTLDDRYFYFYDQKHIVGTDIKQPFTLKGLAIVSQASTITEVAQGIYRMRKLNRGHTVSFVLMGASNVVSGSDALYNQFIKAQTLTNKNKDKMLWLQNIKAIERISNKYSGASVTDIIFNPIDYIESVSSSVHSFGAWYKKLSLAYIKTEYCTTNTHICKRLIDAIETSTVTVPESQVNVSVEKQKEKDVDVEVEKQKEINIELTLFDKCVVSHANFREIKDYMKDLYKDKNCKQIYNALKRLGIYLSPLYFVKKMNMSVVYRNGQSGVYVLMSPIEFLGLINSVKDISTYKFNVGLNSIRQIFLNVLMGNVTDDLVSRVWSKGYLGNDMFRWFMNLMLSVYAKTHGMSRVTYKYYKTCFSEKVIPMVKTQDAVSLSKVLFPDMWQVQVSHIKKMLGSASFKITSSGYTRNMTMGKTETTLNLLRECAKNNTRWLVVPFSSEILRKRCTDQISDIGYDTPKEKPVNKKTACAAISNSNIGINSKIAKWSSSYCSSKGNEGFNGCPRSKKPVQVRSSRQNKKPVQVHPYRQGPSTQVHPYRQRPSIQVHSSRQHKQPSDPNTSNVLNTLLSSSMRYSDGTKTRKYQ